MRHRATLAMAAALTLLGCERKAPGPQECHDFALQALGIPHGVKLLPPRAKAAVDELTVQCITTPYDRQLLRCVEEGRDGRRCLAEFKRRAQLRETEP